MPGFELCLLCTLLLCTSCRKTSMITADTILTLWLQGQAAILTKMVFTPATLNARFHRRLVEV